MKRAISNLEAMTPSCSTDRHFNPGSFGYPLRLPQISVPSSFPQTGKSGTGCHRLTGEFKRVECNVVSSLDGANANAELGGNFVVRLLCNAVQDKHKSTKYIQAGMNVPNVPYEEYKVFGGDRWGL